MSQRIKQRVWHFAVAACLVSLSEAALAACPEGQYWDGYECVYSHDHDSPHGDGTKSDMVVWWDNIKKGADKVNRTLDLDGRDAIAKSRERRQREEQQQRDRESQAPPPREGGQQ